MVGGEKERRGTSERWRIQENRPTESQSSPPLPFQRIEKGDLAAPGYDDYGDNLKNRERKQLMRVSLF